VHTRPRGPSPAHLPPPPPRPRLPERIPAPPKLPSPQCLQSVLQHEGEHRRPPALDAGPPPGFRAKEAFDYDCHVALSRPLGDETLVVEAFANRCPAAPSPASRNSRGPQGPLRPRQRPSNGPPARPTLGPPLSRSKDVVEWGRKEALARWVPRERRTTPLRYAYPFRAAVLRGDRALEFSCHLDPFALTFRVGGVRHGPRPAPPERAWLAGLPGSALGAGREGGGDAGTGGEPEGRGHGEPSASDSSLAPVSAGGARVAGRWVRRRGPEVWGQGGRPLRGLRGVRREAHAWLESRGVDRDLLGYMVAAIFDREQAEFQR